MSARPPTYIALTFSPVQGFIEKSRKLRDLYGSSTILSYLADEVCHAARQHLIPDIPQPTPEQDPVVSPAIIDTAQGTPNQIIVRAEGDDAAITALHTALEQAFYRAWAAVVNACRQWIETTVPHQPDGTPWDYRYWQRPWREWSNHAWEFFMAEGKRLPDARARLNQLKYARAWTGINWVGESSTLSGLDSRAWPLLGHHAPHTRPPGQEDAEVRAFYEQLRGHLDEATLTEREQLSIPELVKRLITLDAVNQDLPRFDSPESFKALNRRSGDTADDAAEAQRGEDPKQPRWTGWFMGDGDRAGAYLKTIYQRPGADPDHEVHDFSRRLREWGKELHRHLPKAVSGPVRRLGKDGRIVYAGGDDFLGVLFRNSPHPLMQARDCLDWFYGFPAIWAGHGVPITASVGFVWAAPNVPQRDVLQHCRLAEKAAKQQGRDRLAIRILFNDGKHLEWACPWRFLPLLNEYRDRNGVSGADANWTHLYTDIATLESRHAFRAGGVTVALALLRVYFSPDAPDTEVSRHWQAAEHGTDPAEHRADPAEHRAKLYGWLATADTAVDSPVLWNHYTGDDPDDLHNPTGSLLSTGILGDRDRFLKAGALNTAEVDKALTQWVINLAKVGFHLHREKTAVEFTPVAA
jgi:CRISPR-associated protein Cmr2